jgi:excisionase family DNA binding protein
MTVAPVPTTLLTPVEVATQLRVHPNTVRRWLGDGLLPGSLKTPGGRIFIRADEADRLLQPITPAEGQPARKAALCKS